MIAVPVTVVVVAALVGGGVFAFQSNQANQRAAEAQALVDSQNELWEASVATASSNPNVIVDDEATISFQAEPKDTCDTAQYQTFDTWLGGWTTDWVEYGKCQSRADAGFRLSSLKMMAVVETFANDVGIPKSFQTRLGQLRGLDGTQQTDFDDTSVGPLRATFSYDGGNGLFVQIERVD